MLLNFEEWCEKFSKIKPCRLKMYTIIWHIIEYPIEPLISYKKRGSHGHQYEKYHTKELLHIALLPTYTGIGGNANPF